LTWHYRQADPEQAAHAARELKRELESTVTNKWDVDVMEGKANLEVRPTFINKGEIAKRLVREYNVEISDATSDSSLPAVKQGGPVEFVLCMGDDFTDEDMFRALSGLSGSALDDDTIFTVTVGASTKVTLARWHVLEPEDVIEGIALLANVGKSGEGRYYSQPEQPCCCCRVGGQSSQGMNKDLCVRLSMTRANAWTSSVVLGEQRRKILVPEPGV
jgi:trehalose 6-phosphate synthase/phosphatase